MLISMITKLNGISEIFISFAQKEILYSTILFILIAPIPLLLKKRSVFWQFGFWSLLMIRLILPPDLSHPLSGRNLAHSLFKLNTKNLINLPNTFSLYQRVYQESDIHINSLEFKDLNKTNTTDRIFSGLSLPITWQSYLFMVWALGIMVFLLIYLKRIRFVQTRILNSAEITDIELLKMVDKWKTSFKIKRTVHLLKSSQDFSSFTTGIFSPNILIPQKLLQSKNTDLIDSIIAHEMAHIKRFDDFWIKLQNIIQIIYFFHPVAWIINSRLHFLRECLCDNMVINKKKISPENYGKGLLSVIKINSYNKEEAIFLPCFGSNKQKLRRRIQNLKGDYTMKSSSQILALCIIIIMGAFILPMSLKSNKINPQKSQIDPSAVSEEENITAPMFIPPIKNGKITSAYGMRRHPFTNKMTMHHGTDFASSKGTKVLASADGIVVRTAYLPNSYGKMIEIKHSNQFITRYAQLDTILVYEGQGVKQGKIIGLVGSSGISTGPHLHFELHKNDDPVDSREYIQ